MAEHSVPCEPTEWVWGNETNTRICNDRSKFINYIPFKCFIYTGNGWDKATVEGVGAVAIEVKIILNRSGSDTHKRMTFGRVLYVPEADFNVMGLTGGNQVKVQVRGKIARMYRSDDDQQPTVALFELVDELYRMRIMGVPRKNQTRIGKEALRVVNIWPDTEQMRYMNALKRMYTQHLRADPAKLRQYIDGIESKCFDLIKQTPYLPAQSTRHELKLEPVLTQQERQWLKRHFKDEFHLLRDYGHKIYSEEDRSDGRRLLREFMADDAQIEAEAVFKARLALQAGLPYCAGCNKMPMGLWHHCQSCDNFNYCSDCVKNAPLMHVGHEFERHYFLPTMATNIAISDVRNANGKRAIAARGDISEGLEM